MERKGRERGKRAWGREERRKEGEKKEKSTIKNLVRTKGREMWVFPLWNFSVKKNSFIYIFFPFALDILEGEITAYLFLKPEKETLNLHSRF